MGTRGLEEVSLPNFRWRFWVDLGMLLHAGGVFVEQCVHLGCSLCQSR
jgi:hypothetical protein